MAMTRWEPFEGWAPLRDAVNQLLEDSVIRPMRFGFTGRTFPVDVYETETEYVVEALLPGVRLEDLRVTALRDMLTIHATLKAMDKPNGTPEQPGYYVRRERFEGELTRTIELPTDIAPDKVAATYEHGVLKLSIPKAEEAKPKQIAVQVKETPDVH